MLAGQGWAGKPAGRKGRQLNLNLRRILTPAAPADLAPSFARHLAPPSPPKKDEKEKKINLDAAAADLAPYFAHGLLPTRRLPHHIWPRADSVLFSRLYVVMVTGQHYILKTNVILLTTMGGVPG